MEALLYGIACIYLVPTLTQSLSPSLLLLGQSTSNTQKEEKEEVLGKFYLVSNDGKSQQELSGLEDVASMTRATMKEMTPRWMNAYPKRMSRSASLS